MTVDQVREKLEPWLAKYRRPAWKPIVEEGDRLVTASKFAGTPWIGQDAPWPDCGRCEQPLPLFLQLDLGSLPDELGQRFGTGLLQLFYCTRERCQGFGGWEPFVDDLNRVRVVHPAGQALQASMRDGLPPRQIVGWERFIDLPTPEEHADLGLKYVWNHKARTLSIACQELGLSFNDLPYDSAEEIANSRPGDKLAGWPAWIQGVEYPSCPQCRTRMVHLFQVDSEDNVPFMFGDVGCGHITQCPEHKEVVAFGWACS
jgi:uncharacterized protein YwqG